MKEENPYLFTRQEDEVEVHQLGEGERDERRGRSKQGRTLAYFVAGEPATGGMHTESRRRSSMIDHGALASQSRRFRLRSGLLLFFALNATPSLSNEVSLPLHAELLLKTSNNWKIKIEEGKGI
ncbi:hypothetical protein PIB30_041304 [Stylosanthes scabra]|uniref:Uncharacterized protein n=1 Tax=Stylosanthes scabra TaxID=79078 RepID=A0ABU6QE96_9FABA|nr:hypothetical protein [Stylosanthes scabra]